MRWVMALCVAAILFSQAAMAQVPMTAVAQGDSEAAATDVQLPDPLTEETTSALVARLSDADVRALLLNQLNLAAADATAEEEAGPGFVATVREQFSLFFVSLGSTTTKLPNVFSDIGGAAAAFLADRSGMENVLFFVVLAVVVAVGLYSDLATNRLVAKQREAIANAHPEGLAETVKVLSIRLFLDLVCVIVAFMAATIIVNLVYPPDTSARMTLSLIVEVIVTARIFFVCARFLLAPSRPDLRLCHIDDKTAAFLVNQAGWLAAYGSGLAALLTWMATLGYPPFVNRPGFWLGAILHLWIMVMLWQARDGIAMMLIGHEDDATPGIRRFARAWPKIAMGLVAMLWIGLEIMANTGNLSQVTPAAVFTSLIFVLMLPVFDTGIRALVAGSFQGDDIANPEARQSLHRAFIRCGRVVLTVAAVMIVASLWGVSLQNVAEQGFGARVAGKFVEIFLIVLVAYAIWEMINIMISRQLAKEEPAPEDDLEGAGDMGGKKGSRLGTVLPLIRAVLQIGIIVLTVLAVLGELGVNIAPLLAGAGIIGLAIGFGAQTLVRDIVSGLFFLLDDAMRVGEYVDVGGTMGTVEKLSIRSLRLRHHRGPVHTVPYGEILKLTNYSRDWVIVKLKWRVPFDTDINQVKRIFKTIGKELLKHPELGQDFLAPFKSQGVADVDDIGITVRGKFTAKPGKQFMIQREIYVQVQKSFEAAGIEFARRQVTVHIPGAEGAEGEEREKIEQAALAAADADPAMEGAKA